MKKEITRHELVLLKEGESFSITKLTGLENGIFSSNTKTYKVTGKFGAIEALMCEGMEGVEEIMYLCLIPNRHVIMITDPDAIERIEDGRIKEIKRKTMTAIGVVISVAVIMILSLECYKILFKWLN